MKNLKKILALVAGLITLTGAGLAVRNKRAVQKAEENFPPLGNYCNIQGCFIHYFTEGKGEKIVLLHGENGDLYDFYLSPLWNKLKEKYQVIAFDRPGSGYSKRADWKDYGFRNQGEIIHQVIEHLGLDNALLVGYGESAGIILSMLFENEESYKGAVLVEDKLPEAPGKEDMIISIPLIGNILLWTLIPIFAERKVKNKQHSVKIPEELLKKSKTLNTSPLRLLSSSENKLFMQAEELNKLADYHGPLTKPVTVIHSNNNSYHDFISLVKLNEKLPKIKFISLPYSNEFYTLINSDKVFEEIEKIT